MLDTSRILLILYLFICLFQVVGSFYNISYIEMREGKIIVTRQPFRKTGHLKVTYFILHLLKFFMKL